MAASTVRLSLLCLLFALSCRLESPEVVEDSSSDRVADDGTAIRDLVRAQTGALNRGDLEAFLSRLHPSVVYMPYGESRIEGREAVGEALAAWFARYEVNVSYHSQEIEVVGEWAFERGRFVRSTLRRENGTTTVVNGSSLRVLTRESDGSWRILREIWTVHPTHEADPGIG